MTDWFRSWHGAPTDPKWLGIARRAGVAPGIAVAVAWALMDRASQASERGSIEGYDADGLACFFGCEPDQVEAIVAAMSDKGMIVDGRFTSWEKRQPKREDDSSERVREHRKRMKEQSEHDVTQRNAPDTETDKKASSLRSEATRVRADDEFEREFWPAYPHKVGKADAQRKFVTARRKVALETIMAGLRRYAAKTDDRPWCNPATWLHQERWNDQPAAVTPFARGSPPPKPPTAQEILRAQRQSFADHDGPAPDRPNLIAAR